MPIAASGYAHVRLTVRDFARSRAFYDDVFGLPVAYELPPDADEDTRRLLSFLMGGVIYAVGDSLFGIRPGAPADDRFDENRVGLDHLSFEVGTLAELEETAAALDRRGIAHAGIKDIGRHHILEFRDPDNIALELIAPK
ncbi:VOC family protein [Jatrophihabitans sp.]|uniref:VOC family protein n=1 Tax=Jatrophihabitans sp. TaxID=1932789 RepID=UPI002D1B379C|nr:VOC family protein [Jatrophihabitans sp.]